MLFIRFGTTICGFRHPMQVLKHIMYPLPIRGDYYRYKFGEDEDKRKVYFFTTE